MRIGLKILRQFQVQDTLYMPGKFVPDDVWASWPQESVANRLNNGYVKWEPVADDATPEPGVEIDQLDKAGLIEYAAQLFPSLTLDARQNIITLRQQVKAIKERAEVLAGKGAAQAARSGESARSGGGSSSASSPAKQPKPKPEPPAQDTPPAGASDQGAAGGSGEQDQGGAGGDQNAGGTDDAKGAGTGGGSPPA